MSSARISNNHDHLVLEMHYSDQSGSGCGRMLDGTTRPTLTRRCVHSRGLVDVFSKRSVAISIASSSTCRISTRFRLPLAGITEIQHINDRRRRRVRHVARMAFTLILVVRASLHVRSDDLRLTPVVHRRLNNGVIRLSHATRKL